MKDHPQRWPHRPPHLFIPNTMYMVTASTIYKQHFFKAADRLVLCCEALLEVTAAYGWELQAWAAFSNHYHFIAQSPEDASTLKPMIQRLHSQTARAVNRLDGVSGRQVWFQYWDTCLRTDQSYYARLNYVHNNAVKHRLVQAAEQYPYCSAGWFTSNADIALREQVKAATPHSTEPHDDFTPAEG
ncbi:hypothetical protein SE17_18860 [Kouleothrix aurantiaca]|uniref:Transposase IS200-like domain-containing protein n=1 Tax=Kouleothrix aurantiaca TaxID=186479 RepID=A0A0P9FFK3_9CHLR|nr:hypothetical protein SE17_18860 [Kouleothrix aurantiaca]